MDTTKSFEADILKDKPIKIIKGDTEYVRKITTNSATEIEFAAIGEAVEDGDAYYIPTLFPYDDYMALLDDIDDKFPEFKGEYDAEATYEALDIITFEGSCYYVVQEVTGISPSEDAEGEYYQLLAAKGADGEQGLPGEQGPQGEQGPPGDPSQLMDVLSTITPVAEDGGIYTLDLDDRLYSMFSIESEDDSAKSIVFDNVPNASGKLIQVSVLLIMTAACAITHPDGAAFVEAPDFEEGKSYWILYESIDGETWAGYCVERPSGGE